MTEPKIGGLTADQENLWKRFTEALTSLSNHLDRHLKREVDSKLAEYRLLGAIIDFQAAPGLPPGSPIRMQTLARATNVSASRLTYQVNSLEKLGLVQKVDIPTDKRGKGVIITEAGRKKYKKATLVYTREVHALMFDGAPQELEHALAEFTRRVRAIMD
ncbi:MarR family winged helix-turn-helix transcriptional regulator [Rothia nasimurium]|uniref:MarR family winged helix-turn-helix transcriptional regulator n=1 Tax=Rothia nasimurium TaxID=85336 RepID=UPI003B9E827E